MRSWLQPGFAPASGVALLATLVRVGYLLDSRDNPSFDTPVIDAAQYHSMARLLAEGHAPGPDLFWQPALYPLLLSLAMRVVGDSAFALKLVQVALGVATCVVCGWLGQQLMGRRAGWLSGALLALYGPLVFFELEFLATGLACLLSVLMLAWTWRVRAHPTAVGFVVLGVVFGLAAAARPVLIPPALAIGAWLMWTGAAWGRLRAGALVLAGVVLASAPLASWRWLHTGEWSLLPASTGVNFYVGNGPDRCTKLAIRPGEAWQELVDWPEREGVLATPGAHDRFFRERALESVVAHPAASAAQLVGKLGELLSGTELMRNVDVYAAREYSPLLATLVGRPLGIGLPFALLLPTACLGLWCLWRKRPRAAALLSVFLASYACSVVLVFVAARYRLPWVVGLAVPAAVGVVELGAAWRRRDGLVFLGWGGGLLVVATLRSPCPTSQHPDAELWLAVAHQQASNDPSAAEAAFREALTRDADYADAYRGLYGLHLQQRQDAEAVAPLKRYLELRPTDGAAQRLLGALLESYGNRSEAIAAYRRALPLLPGDIFIRARLRQLTGSQAR